MSSSEDVTKRVACPQQSVYVSKSAGHRAYVVRMPSDIAHPASTAYCETCAETLQPSLGSCATTVRQSGNFPLSSQIPDYGITRTTGCCKRVLYVVVPGERRDLVKLCASCAWRIGLAGVFQIPDVDLQRLRHGLSIDSKIIPPRLPHRTRRDSFECD